MKDDPCDAKCAGGDTETRAYFDGVGLKMEWWGWLTIGVLALILIVVMLVMVG